jgi:SAM-dependent methyltransferase
MERVKQSGEDPKASTGSETPQGSFGNKEQFPVLPNLPSSNTLAGKIVFLMREAADMMVASVLKYLKPWLSGQRGSVLDVGCGAQPYRHLLPSECIYQGLDWEGSEAHFAYRAKETLFYDGKRFPFEDQRFDALFATEVLEHVFDYQPFLAECRRVLKASGTAFFSVPFAARYHYIPNDYWRYTPATLNKIMTEAGFKKVEVYSRGTDITVASYKIISIIYRWLLGRIYQKTLGVVFLPLAALSLLIGQVSLWWGIGSTDDCLGYVITAQA